MKKVVLFIIIAIVGIGAGLAGGIIITNSKSKTAIADMQSKMRQSEASLQERIRNCGNTVTQLADELRLAKFEIETLKNPAPAEEEAVTATAGNETTADAPEDNSIPTDTKLYTIKSGDSLWSIAQKQLGNGDRFKEILKLNPNISAESNLVIGTKLKIPAK
jgi:LysM repeat protein